MEIKLKGKLVSSTNEQTNNNDELNEALKALGYKPQDIKKVISQIPKNLKIESQIKEALKLLMK